MTAGTIAATIAAAALIAGCGGDDSDPRTFDAASFVATANEHDAGLALGEPLPYPQEGALEARVLRFEGTGAAPSAPGAETPTDVHGSGVLTVLDDDAAAVTEYEHCQAGGLTCFRAANVALTFSGDVALADLDRLTRALQAMSASE